MTEIVNKCKMCSIINEVTKVRWRKQMKKRIITGLMTFAVVLNIVACSVEKQGGNIESQDANGENIITEDNSIDNNNTELVNAESVEYWLGKMENPDDVVMTLEQIKEYNATMLEKLGNDWVSGYYDIKAFPEKVEGEWLKERICYLDLRNTEMYLKGEAVTDSQWDEYYRSMNLESIPDETDIAYGIIIHNTPVLDLPTEDIMTDDSMDEAANMLQQTNLKINEPVVVLWESAHRDWLYVVANEYIGWIKKADCAYVKTRQEWISIQEQEEIIMVCEDDGVAEINEPLLMGTRLYLADADEYQDLFTDEESIDTENNYVIRFPQKDSEGLLKYQYIAISKENKVSEGYVPYTRSNVLKLAFQELGLPYGWGGIDGKRDCSSYIKDIYACFGFMMPRNSRIQMSMPVMAKDTSTMSENDKEAYIANVQPGAIMGINGHVMLYVGSANNQHYVISMLGSYIPETVTEDFGSNIVNVNKVMVNTLDVKRRNGNTWLQELQAIVEVK